MTYAIILVLYAIFCHFFFFVWLRKYVFNNFFFLYNSRFVNLNFEKKVGVDEKLVLMFSRLLSTIS